jgi:hypothetical protein
LSLSTDPNRGRRKGNAMANSLESARNKDKYLADLSDDDLMREWTAVGEQVERGKVLLRLFSQEHQKRSRLAQLNLEPGDAELLQSAAARGIESEEKVN